MNRTYIIAGNRNQFDMFIGNLPVSEHFLEDYRYVSGPDTLRGITDPHGLFIGTWKLRPDIVQIVTDLLYASRAKNTALIKILNELTVGTPTLDCMAFINGIYISPTDTGVYMHKNLDSVVIGFDNPPPAGSHLEVRRSNGRMMAVVTNGFDTHFSVNLRTI